MGEALFLPFGKIQMMSKTKFYLVLLLAAAALFTSSSCKKADTTLPAIDIMVVSEWAYRNDTLIKADTARREMNAVVQAGIITGLYKARNNNYWNGWSYDWDILRQVNQSLFSDPKSSNNLFKYFLVFKEIPGTDPTVCNITIEIHRGAPYNKNSVALHAVTGNAQEGEPGNVTGDIIQGHYQCCYEAARRAAIALAEAGLLKE